VAVEALAEREGLDLARCSAYSDSFNDLPMLGLVGALGGFGVQVGSLLADQVTEDGLDDLAARLEHVAARTAPFEVTLQGTGTFRPVSPVVFVAVSRGIAEAGVLAADLRAALDAPEPLFPFHPHVTVAHHLDDAALDHAYATLEDFGCDFDVTEVALYLHREGEGWSTHRTFALEGPRPG
jgi:2'-5' RNA ligase